MRSHIFMRQLRAYTDGTYLPSLLQVQPPSAATSSPMAGLAARGNAQPQPAFPAIDTLRRAEAQATALQQHNSERAAGAVRLQAKPEAEKVVQARAAGNGSLSRFGAVHCCLRHGAVIMHADKSCCTLVKPYVACVSCLTSVYILVKNRPRLCIYVLKPAALEHDPLTSPADSLSTDANMTSDRPFARPCTLLLVRR